MDESSPGSPKVELDPTFESMFSSFKQRVTFSKAKKQSASTNLDGNAANIQQVNRFWVRVAYRVVAICSVLQILLPQTSL